MGDDKTWTKERIKSRIDENELDLSLCSLVKVPIQGILNFPKISSLDLSCNRIISLPEQFCKLTNLVQLDLSKNQLTELPADIGSLSRLKKLDLLSNQLKQLPLSFGDLKALQWLDLKSNPIQEQLHEVVGDCLKPAECKTCAVNVLNYMQSLQEKERVRIAKANRRLMEKKAAEKKEEEELRQKKREEKKKRKEEDKIRRMKEQAAQAADAMELTGNGIYANETDSEKKNAEEQGSWFLTLFKLFLCVLLITGLVSAVCVVYFDGDINQLTSRVHHEVNTVFDLSHEYYKKYVSSKLEL